MEVKTGPYFHGIACTAYSLTTRMFNLLMDKWDLNFLGCVHFWITSIKRQSVCRIKLRYSGSVYTLHRTRMHSSRMRTGRSLAVFRGVYLVPGGGVYLVPGGYLVLGGCTWSCWVYLVWGDVPGPGGCTWSGGVVYLADTPSPQNQVPHPGTRPGTPPCEQNE